MTLVLDDWWKEKKKFEEWQRKADKVEAEYKLAMEEIRDNDKVKTLKAAKALLARKRKEEIRLYKKWTKLYKAFKTKYGSKL